MARLNTASAIPKIYTHEGAPAKHIPVEAQLRRSVLSCMLWEAEFYEDGQSIADRILDLSSQVDPATVALLAEEARYKHNLRHVPLLLVAGQVRRGTAKAEDIARTIGRVDEMGELLAMYWKDGRKPIPRQLKVGLAKAFTKFDEYQLAKYDREGPIKLRDIMFLTHPKPKDEAQAATFKRLAEKNLQTPDTWETNLSGGADKKETFERLIQDGKLGYLALLRNIRGMVEAGVDKSLIAGALLARKGAEKVFPFRYVAAARACPQMEPVIDQALQASIAEAPALTGRTVILVDVSYSMDAAMSKKSDMTRMIAAATLSSVVNAEELRVFTFSNQVKEVPPRRGMAGVDTVIRSQEHCGTDLGGAVKMANGLDADRLIVITDEQSQSRVPDPTAPRAYMINIASAKNGVGYGKWVHLDGFSEAVIRWIHEFEAMG